MKIAIITVAGISSRFNKDIPEEEKKLKAIYTETDEKSTLIYQMLKKCSYADQIVVVGGYKFDDLRAYMDGLESDLREKVQLVYNDRFSDLASGYSLYLGLKEAFLKNPDEILFVEGDLDIDDESFGRILDSDKNVLTYNYEPIYANKAVVLYKDDREKFCYAFNSSHGMLMIEKAFSCIFNSGQTWKFKDIDKLKLANEKFFAEAKGDTNLKIIQDYIDSVTDIELVGLGRWTNCNTREDYRKIVSYWEEK